MPEPFTPPRVSPPAGAPDRLPAETRWTSGSAEKQDLFGSLLQSAFDTIFRTQLENLQDGGRLYYLSRIEGAHYATEIGSSPFAPLMQDNAGIKHLPGSSFSRRSTRSSRATISRQTQTAALS